MLISIDIARVRDHISLLQQEYRESLALEESLECWRTQALADGLADAAFLERHLHVVRNQKAFIQKRIDWLNYLADDFSEMKLQTKDILDRAVHTTASLLPW